MAGHLDKTRAAVVAWFRQKWPGANPPTGLELAKIEMPNQKFERDPGAPFGRLTVRMTGRANAAVGGLKIRLSGLLYFQVFTPEDTGTKILADAGDCFAAIFDNAAIPHANGGGHVICRAVDVSATGNREGYAQATYLVPFFADLDR